MRSGIRILRTYYLVTDEAMLFYFVGWKNLVQ
jgi:hypothetical protein